MTPERAADLAYMTTQCTAQGDALMTVQQAILQACAEQREEDARIALKSNSSAGYDIAQAIRGAE